MVWVVVSLLTLGLLAAAGVGGAARGWGWRLALVVAAGVLLGAAVGLPGAHGLEQGVITTADFDEYCGGTALMREGAAWEQAAPWPAKRSRLAGLPAGLAARGLGVIDGLLAQAALGLVVLVLGTAWWACSLGGRAAGAGAVVVLAALGPALLLPRMASFYGTLAAAEVLAGAAVAHALTCRSRRASLLAAVLVWLPVLVDLRGVLWSAPLALVLACWGRAPGALVLAAAAAWGLGRLAYGPGTLPLEVQAWQAANVLAFDAGERPPDAFLRRGFVWGHSALLDLPRTAWSLATMPRAAPGSRGALDPHVLPGTASRAWLLAAVLGLGAAAWRLGSRRWMALATVLPGLVLWGLALASDLAEPRLLVGAGTAVAVALGCALGGRGRRGRLVLVVGLVMVLWPAEAGLSWRARWRPRVQAREGHIGRLLAAAQRGSEERGPLRQRCVAALQEDLAAGHPAGSRWLGPVRQVGGPPERAGRAPRQGRGRREVRPE